MSLILQKEVDSFEARILKKLSLAFNTIFAVIYIFSNYYEFQIKILLK